MQTYPDYPDSTDRRPADYVLFGLGFLGFIVGVSGVVVASIAAAVVGGLLLLLTIACFRFRGGPGE